MPSYINQSELIDDFTEDKSGGFCSKSKPKEVIQRGFYDKHMITEKVVTLDLKTFMFSNPYMDLENKYIVTIDYVPVNS